MRSQVAVLALFAALLTSCGDRQAAPVAASEGSESPSNAAAEKLFAIQCAQCHRLDDALIGPALRGSLAHWNNDTARYKAFIRNSQTVIKSGDAYAVQLFERWNKTVMTPNEGLTEEDLNALVAYLNP